MVRNIFLMALAICVLTACNQSGTTSSIGIVDTSRVFRESEPAKNGVKFLESIQTEMQTALTDIQEKIQKDPKNTDLQQEIQAMYTEFQQRIGAEEQHVVNLLQEALQRTVENHRASNKLSLVVGTEVALAYDKTVDITADIIAEMNKLDMEFKSIIPEQPASNDGASAPATKAEEAPEKK